MPFNMHEYVPVSIEQASDLPAPVAAAPAELLTSVTALAGKLSVHSNADGCWPEGADNDRVIATFVVVDKVAFGDKVKAA